MNSTSSLSPLDLVAQIGSPALWSIAYILIIRRGMLDKSFGMPVSALCANLAFELIFSFSFPHLDSKFRLGNLLWLLPNLGILYTCLRYGRSDYTHPWVIRFFPWLVLACWGAAVGLEWAFVTAYQDHYGRVLGSFTCLLSAVALVAMLLKRNSVRGQSIYIALCLLIGDILGYRLAIAYPTPPPLPPPVIIHACFIVLIAFNFAYVLLLYRQCRAEGIRPFSRL